MANALLLLAILVFVIYLSVPSSEGFGPFNSSKTCSNYDQCYLNSVGSALSTGTAVRKFNKNGDHVQLHVQGNLPETQATFELTSKENCEDHCNGLFDCFSGPGVSPGCASYKAYLTSEGKPPMFIGRLFKFRDGVSYATKNLTGSNAHTSLKYDGVVVLYEGNGEKIPVLKGKFAARSILCNE